MVVLDGFGRLLHFDAVDEVPSARTNSGAVDWSTWFAAASLSAEDFAPADAGQSFAVPYDRQLAWRGRGADGRPLVVTAALLGNRLAYFNVGDNVPTDAESSSIWSTHRGPLAEVLFWVLIVVVFATGALIVYRYAARGRGHR
jgi:hypothetical protein